MLFTDYGELKNNPDFVYLYDRLALYGLLPYYLKGKNKKEVQDILSQIHWDQHELKYRLKYIFLPKMFVLLWENLLKYGLVVKRYILKSKK